MLEYAPLISAIVATWKTLSQGRTLLVGISGIDASGKGFVTAELAYQLEERGWRIATIGVDGWLNLPHIRFDQHDAANCFYEHAIRFDQMFEELVLPLRDSRSINVETDFTEETSMIFRRHRYNFRAIDIVLLEGIFLLKPAYRRHLDLAIWIECSFATALKRAVARCQENLSPAETEHAFETIYFPAQRIHIEHDNPVAAADIVLRNDHSGKSPH